MKVSMIKCNDFACTNFKAIKYTDTPPGAYAKDLNLIEVYNRETKSPDKAVKDIIEKVPLIKNLSRETDVYVFSQEIYTDKKFGGLFQAAFVDPATQNQNADMISLYDLNCKTKADWLKKLAQNLKKLPFEYSQIKKNSALGTRFILHHADTKKLK